MHHHRLFRLLLLCGACVAAGCGRDGEARAAADAAAAPAEVRVARPEPVAAGESLRLPARTVPVEQALIYARATGIVAERRVDIGDTVQAGDVLAVISAPEIDREADRARAALAQAQAALQLADVSLRRDRPLVDKGLLSKQLLDEREAQLAQTQADRQAADAELRRLREIQSFQTVRAPFGGTIAERRIERGDRVNGDSAADTGYLYRLVRLDELRVLLDVPQYAAMQLPPQGSARLRFPELAGQDFEGRIARRSGFIDPGLGTMRVELALANPDGLLPAGLVGEAELQLQRKSSALLVPTNALRVVQGRSMVGVVGADGRYDSVPVTTGRNLGTRIEILGGLAADAQVVLDPNAMLVPGAAVRVAAAGPATAP